MKRLPYQENILAYLRMGATKYIQIPRKELWSGMNIKYKIKLYYVCFNEVNVLNNQHDMG